MRARSREVNIFNMSLLDILTGMLGAFLFLMLGLVPYYMRAKNANPNNPNQTPAVDTVFNIVADWNTTAHFDYFLLNGTTWRGVDVKSMPLSRMAKIENNCCGGGGDTGWQSSSVYANAGDKILLACSLQPAAFQEPPATVTLTFALTEIESNPDGSGLKSFAQDTWAATARTGGAQLGKVYGLYWITITKDTSKSEYNQQYDFLANVVKPGDHLPRGVLPPPPVSSPPPAGPASPQNVMNTLNSPGPTAQSMQPK
jgi:hypothetical protein